MLKVTTLQSKRQIYLADICAILLVGLISTLAGKLIYLGVVDGISSLLSLVFSVAVPVVSLCLALGVVTLRNPVHSLLCLIAVFCNTVVVYLAAQSEFLALVFLIVYVGAIAILFLFVIRLLNVKELTVAPKQDFNQTDRFSAIFVAPRFIVAIFRISEGLSKTVLQNDLIKQEVESSSVTALTRYVSWEFSDIRRFGQLLYTYYSYLFRLIALRLLTARLGAIILATTAISEEK